MYATMQIHGSCASRGGLGVLLLGPPGSGKSDLVLRLRARGFELVADDRVDIVDGIARPPPALAGLLEVRGLGIFRLPYAAEARLALVVDLAPLLTPSAPRLPMPERHTRWICRWCGSTPPQPRRPSVWHWHSKARSAASARSRGRSRHDAGPPGQRLRVVLVTGLSGGGKLSVLGTLEDLGFETVDNPPLEMLADMVGRSERRLAIGVDARTRGFDATRVLETLETLRANPRLRPELVYVCADEATLLRRYTESRRRHPLAPQDRVSVGIAQEQALTGPLREAADLVVDTSDLPIGAMRRRIEQHFGAGTGGGPPGRDPGVLRLSAGPAAGSRSGIRFTLLAEPSLRPNACVREPGLTQRLVPLSKPTPISRRFSAGWPNWSRCSCRGSCKRARNTRPSRSAARADATVPCISSRNWPPDWPPGPKRSAPPGRPVAGDCT